MVNTVSQIDGQAVGPIDAPDTQEADEPPIGGTRLIEKDFESSKHREVLRDVRSGSHSSAETRSNDDTLSTVWDGAAVSAHVVDAIDITTFLEVDPGYVHDLALRTYLRCYF